MEPHAVFVLVLTLAAFAALATERVAIETVSISVLVALLLAFTVVPFATAEGGVFEATSLLSGFGHEALVAICALMVLGRGLLVTGALEPAARVLARLWIARPRLAMLLLLFTCAGGSGFLNDTPIVVVAMPILIGVAVRLEQPPSRTLLPMNYAVLIGGMGTTIGTSTNLLVVSIAAGLGAREFGMFDFVHVAGIAGVAGVLYLWLILPRLLPDREGAIADVRPQVFEAELHVTGASTASGNTLAGLAKRFGTQVDALSVARAHHVRTRRVAQMVLQPGDVLRVRDTRENLKRFETELGVSLHDVAFDGEEPEKANVQVAEVLVTDESALAGRSVREVRLADDHGLVLIGLRRRGAAVQAGRSVTEVTLEPGDLLLVQGSEADLDAFRSQAAVLMLDGRIELPRSTKAPIALLVMVAVVGLAAAKVLPIAVAALAGVVAMVGTGCIDWRDTGRALSAKVVLLVASSLALGSALTATGGADALARGFLRIAIGASPEVVLSLLILLVATVTNFVSNTAAAAIGTPIAVMVANRLGVSPDPFVLAVLFGANLSYATPMGYQTNLLVMSAAGYRFSDFVRGGLPLLILMWALYSWLLPRYFPLVPA